MGRGCSSACQQQLQARQGVGFGGGSSDEASQVSRQAGQVQRQPICCLLQRRRPSPADTIQLAHGSQRQGRAVRRRAIVCVRSKMNQLLIAEYLTDCGCICARLKIKKWQAEKRQSLAQPAANKLIIIISRVSGLCFYRAATVDWLISKPEYYSWRSISTNVNKKNKQKECAKQKRSETKRTPTEQRQRDSETAS